MTAMQFIMYPIAFFLLFYSLYWLALIVLGYANPKAIGENKNPTNPHLLLVLPAYKPGPIFKEVLNSIEKAIEARKNINVYVLLQEADSEYADFVKSKGFFVEEKSFGHLGGNSYQHALRHITHTIQRECDKGTWCPEFLMLVDKDNLLDKDYFNNIPESIYDSYDIMQGKRSSLSVSNSVAFFDNTTEALNDTMFRKAKQNMGLMIEISGSGALIEAELFSEAITSLDPRAPGFDKNFMVQLLSHKRDVRTIYWPSSELYEEKTSALEAHNPQRLRWFGEQYYNALYHGKTLLKAAFTYRRLAAFDYIITLWRPPRSIQVVITPIAAALEIAWYAYFGSWPLYLPLFTASAGILGLAVALFLISQKALGLAMKHGFQLPKLAFNNLFNAAKSVKKENQGKFIHTTHKL
jgi:cellulose synthase/poly-beta-1,6-N-acetylglucosamine synthase-like glycosyltransferase